jgi:hypothetical protein
MKEDDDLVVSTLPALPEEHKDLIKSGIIIRTSSLGPFDGTGYFRMQYVFSEQLFFAVVPRGGMARILRAVYILAPVWGFHNQVGNRVIGFEVFNRGHPGPGPLEEWNCAPDPTNSVTILFGESIEDLSAAITAVE